MKQTLISVTLELSVRWPCAYRRLRLGRHQDHAAAITNATKGWYRHTYTCRATGEVRASPAAPPGTRSLAAALQQAGPGRAAAKGW